MIIITDRYGDETVEIEHIRTCENRHTFFALFWVPAVLFVCMLIWELRHPVVHHDDLSEPSEQGWVTFHDEQTTHRLGRLHDHDRDLDPCVRHQDLPANDRCRQAGLFHLFIYLQK